MAFTVEDGTIVAGANSYIALADARTYAADRGLTLPTTDADCQEALVRGADYIDGKYGSLFQGNIVDVDQTMMWPRNRAYLYGWLLPNDEIPTIVKEAQVQAAVALTAGVELEPAGNSAPVRREKVGALETEYQTSSGRGSIEPRVTAVERLLQPLLINSGRKMVVRA